MKRNDLWALRQKRAGKSTLLNIINNRSFATSGSVQLAGETVTDNETALNHIYLMSEDNLFPPQLKIKDILKRLKVLWIL